ncbi:unnamed protein product [Caenorhabditis bovis]|uniref:Major facilitator superfamily (MFS) profile domain-containing protein n=1 Tax=Caenorhabditis bovis TaxID=2654633 RepID=A0A8S1ECV7_9PELO|nr:unnamed protein product [Caenorhabditis bovis]
MKFGVDWKSSSKSQTIFWHKTRFIIAILSVSCITMIQLNSLIFNFSVICMDDLVEQHYLNNNSEKHWLETNADKSFLLSGVGVGSFFGLIPAIPLISILGVRWLLTIFGIVSALATILFPFSATVDRNAVFLCRCLQGVGSSILLTVVGMIPRAWSPMNELATYLAVISCSFQLANIICMPVAGLLCESSMGWRSIYYIFGFLTLLFHFIFFFFYTDSPKLHKNVSSLELSRIEKGKNEGANIQSKTPYREMFMDKCIVSVWISRLGGNLGFFLLILYGPSYLRNVLDFDVRGTGFATALPYVLSIIVKTLGGQISDRMTMVSEKIRFTFCALLSQIGVAFGFVIMSFTRNKSIAQFAFTLSIVMAGLNIVGTVKCLQLRARHHVHFAISIVGLLGCIILWIAPILVGFFCPDNSPEQWSKFFLGIAVIVILTNIPFPFWSTDETANYAKPSHCTIENVDLMRTPEPTQTMDEKFHCLDDLINFVGSSYPFFRVHVLPVLVVSFLIFFVSRLMTIMQEAKLAHKEMNKRYSIYVECIKGSKDAQDLSGQASFLTKDFPSWDFSITLIALLTFSLTLSSQKSVAIFSLMCLVPTLTLHIFLGELQQTNTLLIQIFLEFYRHVSMIKVMESVPANHRLVSLGLIELTGINRPIESIVDALAFAKVEYDEYAIETLWRILKNWRILKEVFTAGILLGTCSSINGFVEEQLAQTFSLQFFDKGLVMPISYGAASFVTILIAFALPKHRLLSIVFFAPILLALLAFIDGLTLYRYMIDICIEKVTITGIKAVFYMSAAITASIITDVIVFLVKVHVCEYVPTLARLPMMALLTYIQFNFNGDVRDLYSEKSIGSGASMALCGFITMLVFLLDAQNTTIMNDYFSDLLV